MCLRSQSIEIFSISWQHISHQSIFVQHGFKPKWLKKSRCFISWIETQSCSLHIAQASAILEWLKIARSFISGWGLEPTTRWLTASCSLPTGRQVPLPVRRSSKSEGGSYPGIYSCIASFFLNWCDRQIHSCQPQPEAGPLKLEERRWKLPRNVFKNEN